MSATSRRRQGRPPALEDTRGHILDTAARLFSQGGYETSSLAELAEAASMTKPAIYHYFPSKQDIFDALIVRTLDGLVEHAREALAEPGDPSGDLKRFMLAHARFFERNYYAFTTMLAAFGTMENRTMAAEARRSRDEYEMILRGIIERAIAEGAFRPMDVANAGRAVLSLLNWMGRWFRPDGKRNAESFACEYYEMLAGGFNAAGKPVGS